MQKPQLMLEGLAHALLAIQQLQVDLVDVPLQLTDFFRDAAH